MKREKIIMEDSSYKVGNITYTVKNYFSEDENQTTIDEKILILLRANIASKYQAF